MGSTRCVISDWIVGIARPHSALGSIASVNQLADGFATIRVKFRTLPLNQGKVANELRRQYNIFYRPEPLKADGLFHTINLKVNGRKDLVVRARKGYYAPRM